MEPGSPEHQSWEPSCRGCRQSLIVSSGVSLLLMLNLFRGITVIQGGWNNPYLILNKLVQDEMTMFASKELLTSNKLLAN